MAKPLSALALTEERIKAMKKLRPKGEKDDTYLAFEERIMICGELLLASTKLSKPVQQLVYSNLLVNYVSLVEGWVKQTIIDHKGRWSSKGLKSLMNVQTTLGDAYHLFGKEKLSQEAIIAHSYSFSNYRTIMFVLDTLTGGSKKSEHSDETTVLERTICEMVDNFGPSEIQSGKTTPTKFLEWNKIAKRLYHVRNNIVHEKWQNQTLDFDTVVDYENSAVLLVINIDTYIEKFTGKETKKE